MNGLRGYLSFAGVATEGMSQLLDLEEKQKERRKEILIEWQKSKEYPRKKKKKVRKELILAYRIASFSPCYKHIKEAVE